jgi:hypothetical protein
LIAVDTGTIRRVALSPWTEPDTPIDPPSVVDEGEFIEWAEPWLTLRGGPQAVEELADTAYLDIDPIETKHIEEGIEIRPPLAQNKLDELLHKNGIESVVMALYSAETGSILSSTTNSDLADPEPGEIQEGLTIVWQSLCVEVTGCFLNYYPKVRIKITDKGGAVKKLVKLDYEVRVFGTPDIPSGMQTHYFTVPTP